MLAVEEHLIMEKELGRLVDEYKKCTDILVRKEIYKDIQLIREAIEMEKNNL